LDSRAILAEASPTVPSWTAITYGIVGCDDARYAQRAAEATNATWVFYPLYSGRNPDWLERRTSFIQQTDGLIDLVDLMHLESLALQGHLLDVNLSGYIGDAVIGPTFNYVNGPEDVLGALPYYGTSLGLGFTAARSIVEDLISELDGASPRYILFEHKLPQSTNRMSSAARPWVRVRKPFLDYAFFDFCQRLPSTVRGRWNLRERWLRSRYPGCFAVIPNQKTGMPALTPDWRIGIERGTRVVWRTIQPVLARLKVPARPRVRDYHADAFFWRTAGSRARIEDTILRSGSLCCEILGREAVTAVVRDWFERLAAPTQVIGALYVYETYHRDLAGHLSGVRGGNTEAATHREGATPRGRMIGG
jgi:hypothetical protein